MTPGQLTQRRIDLLKLLADGRARTDDELMQATGMSKDAIRRAMKRSQESRYVVIEPVKYSITLAGVARAKKQPITREQYMEKRRAKYWQDNAQKREKREAEKREAERLQEQMEAERMRAEQATVVQSALATRHPLAVAWGAPA